MPAGRSVPSVATLGMLSIARGLTMLWTGGNPIHDLGPGTRAKLATLRAPVLILHGDRHDLRKLNRPLFVPLMKEAGVRVEYREYPGYGHGFYFGGGDDRWGKGADERVVEDVVRDVRRFLDQEMPPRGQNPQPAPPLKETP